MRLQRRRKGSVKPSGSKVEEEGQQVSSSSPSMGAAPSSCVEAVDSQKDNDDDVFQVLSEEEPPTAMVKQPSRRRRFSMSRFRKHHSFSHVGNRQANKEEDSSRTRRASLPSGGTTALTLTSQQQQQQSPPPSPSVLRRLSHKSGKVVNKSIGAFGRSMGALGNFLKGLEEFLFPSSPLHAELVGKYGNVNNGVQQVRVLLDGCSTPAEHYQKIQDVMKAIQHLHGVEGLAAADLEYRMVFCAEHRPSTCKTVQNSTGGLDLVGQDYSAYDDLEEDSGSDVNEEDMVVNLDDDEDDNNAESLAPLSSEPGLVSTENTTSLRSTESLFGGSNYSDAGDSLFDNEHLVVPKPASFEGNDEAVSHCHLCHQRLYHKSSNTPINMENRKRFIADGDMYESIAELCQEYAHQVMCQEAELEWVSVDDNNDENDDDQNGEVCRPVPPHRRHNSGPVRALVSSKHRLIQTSCQSEDDDGMAGRPTLVIITGRGRVRAGIFSRQHLICTSLESSTALSVIREAKTRRLNVVIPDPNARGERFGYETYRRTMGTLFSTWEEGPGAVHDNAHDRDLYFLSHSASGAQVVRYLMDKPEAYLPHIRAIAFTDSTHNIQWTNKEPEHKELYRLLESPQCIYFRCSNEERDSNWYLHTTGEPIKTDEFWQHRFGNIQTYWAGTKEHSLTNWYAHAKIWEHFDQHLLKDQPASVEEEEDAPPPPKRSI